MVQVALAGGSIAWDDAKAKIGKTDPELIKIIEASVIVSPSGGGVRLGPHFGDRQGERIAPFRFEVVNRKTKEQCVLVIEESDDFEFTGRFKFTWEWSQKAGQAEPAGADQPATKPEDKAPAVVQPSDTSYSYPKDYKMTNSPTLYLVEDSRGHNVTITADSTIIWHGVVAKSLEMPNIHPVGVPPNIQNQCRVRVTGGPYSAERSVDWQKGKALVVHFLDDRVAIDQKQEPVGFQ